ncbi:MAG TPA: UDP-3-O-(3-hydroxymyristoyl)glucosamine N-acyltransferase [Burkholderiales bacterium]|nr:UDP-3-O-(3-hydroxymyristoyl)glucosamine N-acyltransferase [Burkholderiales bacterium]
MAGPISLGEIASRLGGRVVGDAGVLVEQVASLEHARGHEIAFFSSARYKAQLAATRAAAVILGPQAEPLTRLPRIVSDNPYAYFARVSQLLNPAGAPQPGVHAAAHVDASARVHASARIDAGAVVGARAEIGERVWIGAGCCIGEGAVIGADGFGMALDAGRWLKVPQIGRVLVGDDVEIGANTTIDRGTVDDTVIEDGVKLDNQIQIGHNCRIGAHTAMAGCAGVAGSAVIGQRCTIGGAAAILGHLSICDDVHVSAVTVISRSIRKPGTYTGIYPFDDNASWARNAALVRHLAELADRVGALEKKSGSRRKKRNA